MDTPFSPILLVKEILCYDTIMKGKTLFITGASRGIGAAIALRAAREGANIVIAAKSDQPHPKLPGTIHSVAKEVEDAGGHALPLKVDVRYEEEVETAMKKAADRFGGIDILINNASAIFIAGTEETPMKRFDLMFDCNVRATFLCSQKAIPYLKKGNNPHILNLSPPLNLDPKWFMNHVAYTMSKYGMSMCTLGMAEELRYAGIAVNSLWPKTTIATSAIEVYFPQVLPASRTPDIVADAAYEILTTTDLSLTGQFLIDEEVLKGKDLNHYSLQPGADLQTDFFL